MVCWIKMMEKQTVYNLQKKNVRYPNDLSHMALAKKGLIIYLACLIWKKFRRFLYFYIYPPCSVFMTRKKAIEG